MARLSQWSGLSSDASNRSWGIGTPNPSCPSAPVTAEVPLRCMPTTNSHGPSGMVGPVRRGGGATISNGVGDPRSAQLTVEPPEERGSAGRAVHELQHGLLQVVDGVLRQSVAFRDDGAPVGL